MRIKFKHSLSGPDYSFAPGEVVTWDKHELIRLCGAGIGEPGDGEAEAAMQEAVDEENNRLKTQCAVNAERDMQAEADAEAAEKAQAELKEKARADKKETAVKPAPEKAVKP